jgi:SAM-dependent methyltransferase
MSERSGIPEPTRLNQVAWNELARAGDEFFQAASAAEIADARQGQWKIRITPQKCVPRDWLEPLKGRELLCLAGGGGRQAPLLAAAGANVTVFDLSELQLRRDLEIAERESLAIRTVLGDMADLSCFGDEQFDLIVNPCSVCYAPSVRPIWAEAYRVLKPGGSLISGMINPVYYLFDALKMDRGELVVRHKIPYSDLDLSPQERTKIWGDSRPIEFGHTISDLIGSQLEVGFQLTGFYEDGWSDNDRLSSMIGTFFATRARKALGVG